MGYASSDVIAQKMRFSIKNFFSQCDAETGDLVPLTEEILNGKLHFMCKVTNDFSSASRTLLIRNKDHSSRKIFFCGIQLERQDKWQT